VLLSAPLPSGDPAAPSVRILRSVLDSRRRSNGRSVVPIRSVTRSLAALTLAVVLIALAVAVGAASGVMAGVTYTGAG
jgi:hypothetical protein